MNEKFEKAPDGEINKEKGERKEKKAKRFADDVFEDWQIRLKADFKKADSVKNPAERKWMLKNIRDSASDRYDDTRDSEQADYFLDAMLAAQHALDNLNKEQIEKIQKGAINWGRKSVKEGKQWSDEDVKELVKHVAQQNEFYFPKESESLYDSLVGKIKKLLGIGK